MNIPTDITYLTEMKLTEVYALVRLMEQIRVGEPGTPAEMNIILNAVNNLLERAITLVIMDAADQGVDLTEMNDPQVNAFIKQHNLRTDGWHDIIGE